MKTFIIFLFLQTLLFAETNVSNYDVTSGIVRRNWGLTKESDGIKFRLAWFRTEEACKVWKDLFYKEQKAECVLY